MELELSQQQKQVLSHRMQLSVRILQMNILDLNQYIKDMAMENPLIELDTPVETEDPKITRLKKLEWLDSVDESNSFRYPVRPDNMENDLPLFDRNEGTSLYDQLVYQIPGFHLNEETERVLRYIIGNLDENGYLPVDKNAVLSDTGASDHEYQAAMDAIHRMDPPGLGAADLRECLLLQVKRMENPSPLLEPLIRDNLDYLAKNQLAKLAKLLQASIDDVKDARTQLLQLNPKPGNGFSSYKTVPYITPDLFIIHFQNSYQIILNDYNQPKVEISSYYRNLSSEDEEAAGYIQNKLRQAQWLMSCIGQRKSTMLRCAGIILERQKNFFEHGPGHLAPLTLTDVSNQLEMHPSTISRAVNNKYLQCQWGMFALSEFFSRGVGEESSGKSQDMVLDRIRHIITEENEKKPLSDQEIVGCLQKEGISISRRTVAKYRDMLGIPAASGRKAY